MATIKGTKAADTLNGTSRDDRMSGYEGNDILNAGAGNDLLDGGRGDDTLFGDLGNDSYLFAAGDGHDVVMEGYGNYGDIDTVKLGAGIDPSQVSLVNAGGDLLIRLATGDELRVVGQFSSGGGIEQIQFTSGPTWGLAEINNAAWEVTGTALGETLFGHQGVDIIQGLGGDDQLWGMDGSDTYLFAAGDGRDVVMEGYGMYGDVDTVKLGAGIDPSQVSLVNAGGDLLIRLATGDELRVVGQFSSGGGIEQIQFTNGPTWGLAEINNAAWEVTGTALGETLFGHQGVDIIQGLGGDDQLWGMDGSDTYLFAAGDGRDVVMEGHGMYGDIDTVKLGAGIDPSQVSLVNAGGDLLIRLATGDELWVAGQFSSGGGIEQIQFTSGPTWGLAEINNAAWEVTGTALGETLFGHQGVDIIQGLGGDDQLWGIEGSDTYLFAAGDGHDVVMEGYGTYGDIDTVKLGAGIDPSQVSLVNAGGDLLIRLTATGDELRVAGQFVSESGIEQIQFAGGPTWGALEINNAAPEVTLTGMPDPVLADFAFTA